MTNILHQHSGNARNLLATLGARYLSLFPKGTAPLYVASPNALLDENINLHEVTVTLVMLHRNRAPGVDQITNNALDNLDTLSLL
ncbi:hypothetical protein HPB48_017285 [Haemaphysalis longicornis]|uniref:Uncharacterized protein n=1 Tax=Haemaphysalis longicornis TaxID=44386 RepID=A0A9J6GM04_HAELO|nr:hypothetical protein HPB48_017285 [Haemaphysalis longicornis]